MIFFSFLLFPFPFSLVLNYTVVELSPFCNTALMCTVFVHSLKMGVAAETVQKGA